MATVVLQTVGAAIGGAIGGPFGAILGRAAGAAAGYAIDQTYLAKDQVVQGPRLESSRILSSIEGAPIPKVYGRNRISGQIIWATRFEEVASTENTGGKGTGNSSSATRFTYFANFAIGLCDGPISGVRRIWADGKELDLTKIEFRVYNGDETQEPEPLIEAKQGLGNAPSYRGTAYILFEGLPLEDYGNRIPQLNFEVIRSIGALERQIKSITVIPGSTEFGYDTELISSGGGNETYNARNRHTSIATTDWQASIDELQMVCPNLESVSLVVSWFGNDLRAGDCKIKPGVTNTIGSRWRVNGLRRHEAHLISQVDEKPAFGGTPDDASVLRAIADLKSRGLRVVLYPFIMMDIPNSNGLVGLSGEGEQPVYPWRGEISCFPQPGSENTADKTSLARAQLETFALEYRSLILHYANLCAEVGGVDGFIIGSELRSLTRVRDGEGNFPFVETLIQLAADCRAILGTSTKITYAADWSEYFGYQPQDGSGDVLFNLDPLWASPSINAIGIDNYMPLSDWRDEGDPDNPLSSSGHSLEYLKSNIAAQEGFDWYYETQDNRLNGIRTPITDGAGEPWIYRYKDLKSWWSNQHYNRLNGIRASSPTAWVPGSKPFVFTEFGCPAVDKGANQPNVFFDPKSAQSALPYFSSGSRDDLIQRRYLEAHYEYWSDANNNPVSQLFEGRMLEVDEMAPWAWDARPFPWFPLQEDIWSDGDNWHLGHWLTGRLGGCSLQDLVLQILKDYGYEDVEVRLDGVLDGYIIPTQGSARSALEPLLALHNILVFENGGKIIIQDRKYSDTHVLQNNVLIQEEGQFEKTSKRENELELPSEAVISHGSVFGNYEENSTKSRRLEGASNRQISLQAPIIMPDSTASKLAENALRESWIGRDELIVTLPISELSISVGDILEFANISGKKWQVINVERSLSQTLTLSSVVNLPSLSASSHNKSYSNLVPNFYGQPKAVLLDLPLLKGSDQNKPISHIAISASPWAGSYNLYSSAEANGFAIRTTISARAVMGVLQNDISISPQGRWDYQNHIIVFLTNGSFTSVTRLGVLNGANVIALESSNGNYELIQFSQADLQPDGSWRLSRLLRAQMGTEAEMLAGSFIGANVILLNQAIYPLELRDGEPGILQNWRVGPAKDQVSASTYTSITHQNNRRSSQLFSPVHLRAEKTSDGNYDVSWIRRGRINSDSWEGADIPLDAQAEQYLLKIFDLEGNLKREVTTLKSGFSYLNQMHNEDFGLENSGFQIEVSQLNDEGLPGTSTRIEILNS